MVCSDRVIEKVCISVCRLVCGYVCSFYLGHNRSSSLVAALATLAALASIVVAAFLGLALSRPLQAARFLLLERLGADGFTLHHLLVGHGVRGLRHRLITRVYLMGSPSGSQDTIADGIPGVFRDCLHFSCALSLFSISDRRLISLLLLIFVDTFKDTVHLLLEE